MNRSQALTLLPIITAFASGKDIQYSLDNKSWQNEGEDIYFDTDTSLNSEFRIKPDPVFIPLTITLSTRSYLFNYSSDPETPDYRILSASEKDSEKEIESQASFIQWIDDAPVMKEVIVQVEQVESPSPSPSPSLPAVETAIQPAIQPVKP